MKKMRDANYGERTPMKSPINFLSLVCLAIFALPFAVHSQQGNQQAQQQQTQKPPQNPQQGRGIILRATEVVVPVTVKDANGDLVATLRPDDFRIFEDDVEQRITHISVEPVPMSAIFLLDNALKAKPEKELQDSVRALAGGIGAEDEAAIFRFDNNLQQITDFISDPDQLLTQLDRLQIGTTPTITPQSGQVDAPPAPGMNSTLGPGSNSPLNAPMAPIIGGNGAKSINDAVYAAARLLRARSKDRRRVIFLISDGTESRGNTFNFNETVKMLQTAEVTVYSIGVGASVIDRVHNVMSRLADATGGDVYYASNRGDLERLYSRTADEARNQYLLYYSPDHVDRVPTFHRIEVRVRLPGLTVMARQGYYSLGQP